MLLRLASSPIPETAPAPPIVAVDARRRAADAVSAAQRVLLVLILLTAAGLRWWRIGAASLWTDELLSLEVSSASLGDTSSRHATSCSNRDRVSASFAPTAGWRQ